MPVAKIAVVGETLTGSTRQLIDRLGVKLDMEHNPVWRLRLHDDDTTCAMGPRRTRFHDARRARRRNQFGRTHGRGEKNMSLTTSNQRFAALPRPSGPLGLLAQSPASGSSQEARLDEAA